METLEARDQPAAIGPNSIVYSEYDLANLQYFIRIYDSVTNETESFVLPKADNNHGWPVVDLEVTAKGQVVVATSGQPEFNYPGWPLVPGRLYLIDPAAQTVQPGNVDLPWDVGNIEVLPNGRVVYSEFNSGQYQLQAYDFQANSTTLAGRLPKVLNQALPIRDFKVTAKGRVAVVIPGRAAYDHGAYGKSPEIRGQIYVVNPADQKVQTAFADLPSNSGGFMSAVSDGRISYYESGPTGTRLRTFDPATGKKASLPLNQWITVGDVDQILPDGRPVYSHVNTAGQIEIRAYDLKAKQIELLGTIPAVDNRQRIGQSLLAMASGQVAVSFRGIAPANYGYGTKPGVDGRLYLVDPADPNAIAEVRTDLPQMNYFAGVLPKPANVQLKEFREATNDESGGTSPDTLLLEYSVEVETSSIRLRFAKSADATFDDSKDRVLKDWKLTADELTKHPTWFKLLDQDVSEFGKPGTHKLLIYSKAPFALALAGALMDAKQNYVLAVSDDGVKVENQVAFAGIYQHPKNHKVVVRGSDGDDEIKFEPALPVLPIPASQVASIPIPDVQVTLKMEGSDPRAVTVIGTSDLLALAREGADVLTDGVAVGVSYYGGPGSDTYRVLAGASGLKKINESDADAGPDDKDELDFVEYDQGIKLDLALKTVQPLQGQKPNVGLRIQLTDPKKAGIENVTGTTNDDLIKGNDKDNVLKGIDGDDTLYGGNGSDSLAGGDGDDTLYGDGVVERNGQARAPGNDILDGEEGNDGLFGGLGTDTLKGGVGADRFLDNGVNEAERLDPEDARIRFLDGEGKEPDWTEKQILIADEALARLQRTTHNTRLLKHPFNQLEDGIAFVRIGTIAYCGLKVWAENLVKENGTILVSTLGINRAGRAVERTIIHELGHNWHDYVVSGGETQIEKFSKSTDGFSGWKEQLPNTPLPTPDPGQGPYKKGGENRDRITCKVLSTWYYLAGTPFARPNKSNANPFEDFATSFEMYFFPTDPDIGKGFVDSNKWNAIRALVEDRSS